jgi:PTH1 family peptidyl-tRNA hydrolase
MNLKQTKLIVGLGNIGREYQDTRHNAGFWCVDYLAEKLGISLREDKKFSGSVGRGMLLGNEVLLLEPSTLMNLSGKSVASAAAFFKIKPSDILVIHDDLDLLPGQKNSNAEAATQDTTVLRASASVSAPRTSTA